LVLLLDTLNEGCVVGCLLVLLDETAETAAARKSNISETAALEIVLVADIGTLHWHRNPVKPEAGGTAEEEASSVDRLITLKVCIPADAVVCLAESDARETPSHQAEINRVEAAKQAVGPVLGILWRARVDNLTGFGQDLINSILPLRNITVADGAGGVVLGWGGHGDYKE
jgi:hypothetical protein